MRAASALTIPIAIDGSTWRQCGPTAQHTHRGPLCPKLVWRRHVSDVRRGINNLHLGMIQQLRNAEVAHTGMDYVIVESSLTAGTFPLRIISHAFKS